MGEKPKRKDRIRDYLIPKLDSYLFDELSPDYLERAGVKSFMAGVPIPVKSGDFTGNTTSTLEIARNMIFVIGCDPDFPYREAYIRYILKLYNKDFAKPMINEGIEMAQSGDYESACACFRGALALDPDSKDAMFCLGRACKDAYENGNGNKYVANFKAEALYCFERLTIMAPDFDMGFYYLGFSYLNLGLYRKAKLTFDSFMAISSQVDLREEVSVYQEKLKEPVRIEDGCNEILRGNFQYGITVLSRYTDDQRFNKWWPLWYYLGLAQEGMGNAKEAEEGFLEVLKLSPSNQDAMKELVDIYRLTGEEEKAEKYQKKIEIVRKNAEMDREEQRESESAGKLS